MQKLLRMFALLIMAAVAPVALGSEAAVKSALQKKYPQIQIQSVTKTPLAGILGESHGVRQAAG